MLNWESADLECQETVLPFQIQLGSSLYPGNTEPGEMKINTVDAAANIVPPIIRTSKNFGEKSKGYPMANQWYLVPFVFI